MPNLDLLVRADDQASRALNEVQKNLVKAGRTGQVAGKQIASGSKQADAALKRTAASAKKASAQTSRLASAAGNLKTQLLAVVGTAAFLAFMRSVVQETIAAERALIRLNNILKVNGEFTEDTSREIQDWAIAQESAVKVSKDLLLNLFALGRGFSNSADQARELVNASLDFAVGADLEVTEAVRRLGRAVRGSAADVSNFAPEIRKLTVEQLAAGEATRIIAERFAGAASEQANTLGGRVQGLSLRFRDLQAALGEELVPVMDSWINALEKATVAARSLFNVQDESLGVDEITIEVARERVKSLNNEITASRDLGVLRAKRVKALSDEIVVQTNIIVETKKRIALSKAEEDASKRRIEGIKKEGQESEATLKKRADALTKFNELNSQLSIERIELSGREFEAEKQRILFEREARKTALRELATTSKQVNDEMLQKSLSVADEIADRRIAALQKTQREMTALGQVSARVSSTIADGFGNAFADVLLEGKTLEEGMKSIFRNISRVAIQELTKIAVKQALLSSGGAFGIGGFAIGAALIGGGGGIFQHGTQRVPGPVGRPVAAILHGGEEVRTAGATGGGGGGGGGNVSIVVNLRVASLDPSERRGVIQALTQELRQATDSAREFASETIFLSDKNSGRAT